MRRTSSMYLIVLTLLLAALSLLAANTATAQSAEPDLGVSPEVGELSTTPGRTISETVTVINLSEEPLQVGVSLEDLEVDRAGRYSAVPSSDRPTSAVPWGFVEPQGLQLPAGNSRTIKVVMTPPAGTAAGGYAAALRFSMQSRGRTSEYVRPVLVDVSPDGIVRSAKISSIFIPSRSFGSSIPVTIALENTGPLHVTARGTLVVTDAMSRVTARIPITRTIVLRGRTRVLAVDVPAPLVPWKARVRADIGFGPGIPRVSTSTTGYAFTWFGIGAVAAVVLLIVWTLAHFIRRRSRKRHEPIPAARPTVTPEPAVRKPAPQSALMRPAEPAIRRSGEPAVRRTRPVDPEPRKPAVREPVVVSQPVLTEEDLEKLWGPVVARAKERPEVEPSPPPGPSTAEVIRLALADTASGADEVETSESTEEPEDVGVEPRVIVLPDSEQRDEPRVIRLDRESEQAPVRGLEPVMAEPFAESASIQEHPEEPALAAAMGSEGTSPRPHLTVLPREHIVEPVPSLTPAAVARRARVALDMLHDGAGRTGARVEVALDVLKTVKTNLTVNSKVEEAYEAARKARDRQALAPLALALAAVGSPAAPAALLRAYAGAPDALADSLLAAIKRLPAEELKANRRLISALPAERRAAVRGD